MLGLDEGIEDVKLAYEWCSSNVTTICLMIIIALLVWIIRIGWKAFINPWINERKVAMDTICGLAETLKTIAEQHPKFEEDVKQEFITFGGKVSDLSNIVNGLGTRMAMYEHDREAQIKEVNDHKEQLIELKTQVKILITKL